MDVWFSADRMSTYRQSSHPEDLYVWNTRVSKALLEDIQHVEVLLRNFVHRSVSTRYGNYWFSESPRIPFDAHAQRAIQKAVRRACPSACNLHTPGKIIAELNLDFWRFLLTSRYQTTIWPLIHEHLHLSPGRVNFEHQVKIFYEFRNRAAHHEPVIKPSKQLEDTYLTNVSDSVLHVAGWIDPRSAQWIASKSRVQEIRAARPQN